MKRRIRARDVRWNAPPPAPVRPAWCPRWLWAWLEPWRLN
jgi:hypothetical protein